MEISDSTTTPYDGREPRRRHRRDERGDVPGWVLITVTMCR